MIRTHHYSSLSLAHRLFSLLLAYALLLSTSPFALRGPANAAEANGSRASNASAPARQSQHPRREGQLLVRFREGVSQQERNEVAQARGARRAGALRGESRIERLELPAGQDPEIFAAELRLHPAVELAEPNYLIRAAQVAPNDPQFIEQWALQNNGQMGGLPGADIGATAAWATTTGSPNTVIAVIDSGIDFSHPDLRNNRWTNPAERANRQDDDRNGLTDDLHGWDFITNSGEIRDEQGHGTAIAGLIAAEGNNQIGTTGVMWRASLMSLRALDSSGTGDVAGAVEAIDYAVSHGALVINCAWGLEAESMALRDAIERAGRRGAVVVTAAGNGGRDLDQSPFYPASYGLSNVIAVAATDGFDNLASWSNYGSRATVAAPGVDLLTTSRGGGYTTISGTSAASALVAGIAGLIKADRWHLSASGTRAAITGSVRRVGTLEGRVASGGVAQAAAALLGPQQQLPNPTTSPSPSSSPGGNNGGGNGAGQQTPIPPPPMRGAGGTGPGGSFAVAPLRPTQGPPGPNLPNLDEARRQRPAPPRIADPIPSNHPYCWPGDPACRPRPATNGQRVPPPAPTPPPRVGWNSGDGAASSALAQMEVAPRPMNLLAMLGSYLRTGWQEWLALPGSDRRTLSDAPEGVRVPVAALRSGGAVGYTSPPAANSLASLAVGSASAANSAVDVMADCDSVWGYAAAFVTVYIYQDGLEIGQTFSDGNGYFSHPLSIFDSDAHHIAAYYYDPTWGFWLSAGETWVSGCMPDFSPPRLEPQNETGQPGVDTGSQNINWSVPLVSLPGRAGLDLNLALTYNSLVWTKRDSAIMYDADHGSPSPGFRLGLPIIQPQFYNPELGVYSYLLITSAGGRVELRQANGTNVYEAADGSYTQMIDYGNGTALVRTSDGTMMSFALSVNSEMRCTQIKDRNGNYISLSYNANGNPTQITDTLGRVVSFNYDPNNRLTSITQQRNGSTYTWATFGYSDIYIQPDFPGLFVYGPPSNPVSLLTQVGLPDGSRYNFEYTAFGQINLIRRYAADNHQLAYTSYNMGTGPHSDCPRFSEQRQWAENWNDGQEALTSYVVASDRSWTEVTLPDRTTIQKDFFYTTGWQRGLTYQTETWFGGVRRKWTTTAWTQDNTNVSYPLNPRPYDISVYDEANNRRRIDIIYTSFSLPYEVREYSTDGSGYGGFLRRTYTDYRFDQAYLDRRIIGLVNSVHVVDENNNYVSKTVYHYDWADGYLLAEAPSAQHDTANYGAGFVVGRGNLVGVWRFNVNAINDTNQAIWVRQSGYDLAGSTRFVVDGAGHRTNISYTDSFSDGQNRGTLAYPTTVTDPDNFSSTAQYNYDTGAVTRQQDPLGAVQTMQYDAVGRLERVTNQVNGAYTRQVYPNNNIHILQYATIQAGAGEAYSFAVYDGVGRLRASGGEHPGSVGGYRAQYLLYNAMGRLTRQSNPTEIAGDWTPAGDDAGGWQWTQQAYDWQGRPTLTTLPDGQTRLVEYSGCGCAGGEVITTRDERGRRRRLTHDVLGRLVKAEELHYDQSVYATSLYSYNARDQLTGINQAGQVRSLTYDGHGRLQSRTTPEQGQTTYSHYADDAIQTITDARGASQTFSYNGRHLVTGISFGVPGGVAATPNVSFSYDAAGNRTGMTDGHGSVSYQYDTLSRLTQETRTFNGVGSFTLTYGYNLAGQLTSITNPWSAQVGYNYDRTGQLTQVTGANYAGVSSYASGLSYRAFGALKWLQYGNGRTLAVSYDNRLRMTRWDVAGVLGYQYAYATYYPEHTGRVMFADQLYDDTLDRSYDYDHRGRLHVSYTGAEARAHAYTGQWGTQDGPYAQGYLYDVWGNLVERQGWGGENAAYTASYTNNRRAGATYDAAGNITNDGGQAFTYDATGQQAWASHLSTEQGYDGDRLRVRRTENGVTTYYLRSSVLGGRPVAEITSSGGWARGYVYLGSQLLALQQGGVEWTHQDPVTKSQRLTDQSGNITAWVELDPWGGECGSANGRVWSVNSSRQPQRYTSYIRDANQSDEAMMRRYNRWWSRFDQPDPYDGSYDLTDPQSFNRYAYVQNDPVNFVDPTGLCPVGTVPQLDALGVMQCVGVGSHTVTVTGQAPGSGGVGGGGSLFDGQFVPEEPPPDETGGGGDGGGGTGPPNSDGYPGGSPNPIAQLGPCPELVVPTFNQLGQQNQAALTLLRNTYGAGAEAAYNRLSTYERAVFLNTAAAAASVGVNFSQARFDDFYRSDKPGNLPYGIYVTGASGRLEGRHAQLGSVELDTRRGRTQIDVDLYSGNPFGGVYRRHIGEVRFNNRHNRPTHPGDVIRQLAARGVNSGVSCR